MDGVKWKGLKNLRPEEFSVTCANHHWRLPKKGTRGTEILLGGWWWGEGGLFRFDGLVLDIWFWSVVVGSGCWLAVVRW